MTNGMDEMIVAILERRQYDPFAAALMLVEIAGWERRRAEELLAYMRAWERIIKGRAA